MTEITVLAVTRLSTGVCIAGITNDGNWIRPTRPNHNDTWRQLEYEDCKDANGIWVVKKGNVVRMDILGHIPSGAHTEDWKIGSRKPELTRMLDEDEYMNICEECSEDSLGCLEREEANRSLIMVCPDEVNSFSFCIETDWEGRKKFIPRCTFKVGEQWQNNIGVSDAEWRGLGRQFIKEKGGNVNIIRSQEIFNQLEINKCWFTIGRNEVNSKAYLLVVGIHLFPVKEFEMDFERI